MSSGQAGSPDTRGPAGVLVRSPAGNLATPPKAGQIGGPLAKGRRRRTRAAASVAQLRKESGADCAQASDRLAFAARSLTQAAPSARQT